MIEPGFVAVTASDGHPVNLTALLAGVGVTDAVFRQYGAVRLAHWGLASTDPTTLVLTRTARTRRLSLDVAGVRALVDRGAEQLIMPPFGVLIGDPLGVTLQADSMGLRQLYHGSRPGIAALSTSAGLLARVLGGGLDHEAIAVQSRLGWQLGQRTLFADVTKLIPGARARLAQGQLDLEVPTRSVPAPIDVDDAVEQAADLLTEALEHYLDDRPDAVLQLTGGQDSRLLLSAIPADRRRGLCAMTLGGPGDPDVVTAATIAARYGMRHEVHAMDGLDAMDPGEAWARCRQAALLLDGMSDPLAFAALAWAEDKFEAAPRLSGLGGEVARGFYYLGSGREVPVTAERAKRLADWRMFVNEAVEPEALTAAFVSWAHPMTEQDVYAHLQRTGKSWLAATDDLYLNHRMQRWAGVTETAWCQRREITNPMLDHAFLELAQRLSSLDKRNSRFLSRLQMRLDPELGQIPLEGRPAPVAYTRRSLSGSVAMMTSTGRRMVKKVGQRVRRTSRPPAGGAVLSRQVVAHWQAHPDVLEKTLSLGVVDERWARELLRGDRSASPSAVAFLTSLVVADELSGSVAVDRATAVNFVS